MPALYLALNIVTAVKEASQGLAHRIDPLTLCAYEVDCDPIADLTAEEQRALYGVEANDMKCAWAAELAEGKRPASWSIHDQLVAQGVAGIRVPSFAPGADANDVNLVLWMWGPALPRQVRVIDPRFRLPRDQSSWR
ncbi:RES domain protein [Variibacter gotjawalensis]|uniref:RES domain protein n=1 Tax=Variibacter gotjawalensis TaxID=1333996 RepID=A0A0S3PP62_9BRAD|nr:RES domain-containing protein [Variibacter gotjawalensis]BAT57746.1 RES domain protein [Variibacter gotjawalensis]